MTNCIEILVPLAVLPGEGADTPEFGGRNGKTTPSDLLKYYLELTADSPLVFRVNQQGIGPGGDEAAVVELQHSCFRFDGATGDARPWFDLSPSRTALDLRIDPDGEAPELAATEEGDPREHLRLFLGHFQERLACSARGFSGSAIPLLRWGRGNGESGEDVLVQLCGVVLADDELLKTLKDAAGKDGGISFDDAFGLVLEEAEVEGRGLREAMASLAVLGIVAATVPSAEAGLFDAFKSSNNQRAGMVSVKANSAQAPAQVNERLLQAGGDTEIVVDVSAQRAFVLIDGQIAVDTPVSTARAGKYTPRGEFKITQRVRSGKTSTIYGCSLPYWMRLDESAIGMHVGDLPGYPASAGCVRLPSNIAPLIFEATANGTSVKIVDSWQASTMMLAQR